MALDKGQPETYSLALPIIEVFHHALNLNMTGISTLYVPVSLRCCLSLFFEPLVYKTLTCLVIRCFHLCVLFSYFKNSCIKFRIFCQKIVQKFLKCHCFLVYHVLTQNNHCIQLVNSVSFVLCVASHCLNCSHERKSTTE